MTMQSDFNENFSTYKFFDEPIIFNNVPKNIVGHECNNFYNFYTKESKIQESYLIYDFVIIGYFYNGNKKYYEAYLKDNRNGATGTQWATDYNFFNNYFKLINYRFLRD